MDYIEVKIFIEANKQEEFSEIVIAMLGDQPFESFDEFDNGIRGFIPEPEFDEDVLSEAILSLDKFGVKGFELTRIKDQNWNKTWESNYEPILIGERCFIRAPFHEPMKDVDFDLVIEPKMSFGTAHHETTNMMIQFVLENKWDGLEVLDMGCGTGVLAILASQMGARNLMAIDNDHWAYENTLENIERNNVENVAAQLGGKELLGDTKYDVVLANINRNILLDQLPMYGKIIRPGGKLYLSGFYEADVEILRSEAQKSGFVFLEKKIKNKWVSLKFKKQAA